MNERCGTHVHVSRAAGQFDADTLVRLCKIIYSKQDLLYKALGVEDNSRRIDYCKKVKPCTPVAIWRITDNDLSRLDRYEGYPTVYNRVEIPVKVSDMELVKCMVYVMTEGKEVPYNVPSLEYLYTVMCGYKANGLNPKFLYEALATAYKKSNK